MTLGRTLGELWYMFPLRPICPFWKQTGIHRISKLRFPSNSTGLVFAESVVFLDIFIIFVFCQAPSLFIFNDMKNYLIALFLSTYTLIGADVFSDTWDTSTQVDSHWTGAVI